jgi:hypothetical protein
MAAFEGLLPLRIKALLRERRFIEGTGVAFTEIDLLVLVELGTALN